MKSEVFNQDCMEGMRELPDNFADLAVCDPPYGIGVSKMAYTQEDNMPVKQKNGNILRVKSLNYKHADWDNKPPSPEYFIELFRVSKNQIIWGVNYMPIILNGGRIVWNKLNGNVTFSNCEIAYCSKHNNIKIFNFMWSGMCQGSTANGSKMEGNKKLNETRIHPTQKPVQLYGWIYKNYLPEGGKVIDTHLGSGSNRIAADKAGNIDFTGYEIDKEYYEKAERRYKDFKSQLRLF